MHGYIFWPPPGGRGDKNNAKREDKKRGKSGKERKIGVKKRETILILFYNIGCCDKSAKKNREEFQNISRGRGKIFLGGHKIYPCLSKENGFQLQANYFQVYLILSLRSWPQNLSS